MLEMLKYLELPLLVGFV